MFKIYDVKGIKVPIIDIKIDNEEGYIYSTLGFVGMEIPEKCTKTVEELIEKNSAEIIEAYKNTEGNIIYRSDEEFKDILTKAFTKYEKKLGIKAKDVYITPLSLRNLAFAYIDEDIEINSYMKYMDEEIIQYTIYHELCHLYTLKNYNTLSHDEDFYNILYKEYPKEEVDRIIKNQ